MDFYIKFPFRKYIDKQIKIVDVNNVRVGFVRRKYKKIWDKLLHYLPIFFLHKTNMYGKSNEDTMEIYERTFKENLKKLKWDVYFNGEEPSLLEDRTKITTNIRMVYHKNNKEYVFKKDVFHKTCKVSINGGQTICAEIILERAPAYVKVNLKTNDLTHLELLGVYYMMYLVYL